MIDNELKKLGFLNCTEDVCVYSRCTEGQRFLLAIYVDDLVFASTSIEQISELKGHLRRKFFMKPIGDIDYVLGLKVERNRRIRELRLSQETYAKKVLDRFGMADSRPINCPVAPNTTLEVHEGTPAEFPYSQAVGSIMYLAMGTRPDVAYGVGLVSRFASNPGEVHVKAVKRILRYLRATTSIGLVFGGSRK